MGEVEKVEGPFGHGRCTTSLITFVDRTKPEVSAVLDDGELVFLAVGDVRDGLDNSEDDCLDGGYYQFYG